MSQPAVSEIEQKLREAQGWQPMETAPTDGTRVWLKNSQMRQPVIGQMDDYRSEFSGAVSRQWIVTHDPYDRFMPLQYGSLCVPTLWMPLASGRTIPGPDEIHAPSVERCYDIACVEAGKCIEKSNKAQAAGNSSDMYRHNTAFHAVSNVADALRELMKEKGPAHD